VQYRVQFIDGSDKVVREVQADAGSAANAFLLVADNDWPPDAVRVRVLDRYGRVLAVSKPTPVVRRSTGGASRLLWRA
jgi:hypothetical protein